MARNASPSPQAPILPPSSHRGWRRILDALLGDEPQPEGATLPEPAPLGLYRVRLGLPSGTHLRPVVVRAEGPGHAVDLAASEQAMAWAVTFLAPLRGYLNVQNVQGEHLVTVSFEVARLDEGRSGSTVDARGALWLDGGDVITGSDPGDENDHGGEAGHD